MDKKNINMKLVDSISKMEPIEFIGLARLLGVKLISADEGGAPREFVDVLTDIMEKFNALNRTRKREILKLVEKSISQRRK